MTSNKLAVDLTAEITRTWRNDDGNGPVDSEYWTVDLKVLGWPEEANTLMARSRQELEVGSSYSLNGKFYINSGKDSTQTYILVEASKKIIGEPNKEELKPPSYVLVAKVTKLEDKTLWVSWTTLDDYNNVQLEQTAQLQSRVTPPPGSENMVDKKSYFEGTMNGVDHEKDWSIIAAGIAE